MARTITITFPANTTVILPSSANLAKAVSDGLNISIDNQTNDTISLGGSGTASSFSVDAMPATIADGISDDIELTVLGAGDIDFAFDVDEETISVTVTAQDIMNASGGSSGNQKIGGVVISIGGRNYQTLSNNRTIALSTLINKYADRFDDPTYYDGDSA